MRLDMDLFRDLLIAIENKPLREKDLSTRDFVKITGKTEDEIIYHLHLLNDASFFIGIPIRAIKMDDFRVERLTFSGHEYLNNIRDNSIWQKTKEKLMAVGSSASVEIIGQVAGSYIKKSLGLG